jgi:hypothetical protein
MCGEKKCTAEVLSLFSLYLTWEVASPIEELKEILAISHHQRRDQWSPESQHRDAARLRQRK